MYKTVCEKCKTTLNECIWCKKFIENSKIWHVKVYSRRLDHDFIPPSYKDCLVEDLRLCEECWKCYIKKTGETFLFYGGEKDNSIKDKGEAK